MLKVYRSNIVVGTLDVQVGEPFYGFSYDTSYLGTPGALPLSLSLPLMDVRYSGNDAMPYFEGLLPEGDARNAIARRLGISPNSPAKLLKALGRDCAGDIAVLEQDELPHTHAHHYFDLGKDIVCIAENPYEEITQLQERTRLSLAGGQEKIALYHDDEQSLEQGWFIPSLGSPSTHILKPEVLGKRYPNLALNEFLCMRAAALCSIPAAVVDILYPETPMLIVKRYDRVGSNELIDGLAVVHRIHQEDCCQACGIVSSSKYERDGGPGFERIRHVLVRHSAQPACDINALVRLTLFNYLIGNCDAHAKNYSLMQNKNDTVSLAPAYDVLCTTIYDGDHGTKLSRNMAMKIGEHANIDKVSVEDVAGFTRSMKVRPNLTMQIRDDLIDVMKSAFETACDEAVSYGFDAADEVVERIFRGVDERVKVLLALG